MNLYDGFAKDITRSDNERRAVGRLEASSFANTVVRAQETCSSRPGYMETSASSLLLFDPLSSRNRFCLRVID